MRPGLSVFDAHPLAPLLALGASALLVLGMMANAAAQSLPHGVYVIPAGGYSVDECVAKSTDCGRVVANAWCEANGHGAARAFGVASDVTFSADARIKSPPPDAVVIACAD